MLSKSKRINNLLKSDNVMQNVCMFNYINLQKLLDNPQNHKYFNNVNIFRIPYILYKLNKIYEAYKELEMISMRIKETNNILFVISEYNKQQIGYLIRKFDLKKYFNDDISVEKEYDRISNTIKNININNLINSHLTLNEQYLLKNKLDGSEIKKYKDNLMSQSDNVDKGYNFLSGIKEYHLNIFKEYTQNYIFIEDNSEYKNLFYYSFKNILNDTKNTKQQILADDITKNSSFFETSKEHIFDYLDIFFMIVFLDVKQLESLFDISELNILLFEDKDDLFIAYKNLISSIIKFNLQNEKTYTDYLRKFFIIFSKINITKNEFNQIIKLYMNILNIYKIHPNTSDLYKNLMQFIITQYNDTDRRKNIDISVIETLLLLIYHKTIKEITPKNFMIKNSLIKVIGNLSYIIQNLDKNYIFPCKSLFKFNEIFYISNFYIPMYKLLNDKLQLSIKTIIKDSLTENFSVDLFYNASFNKIIRTNSNYENKLLNEAINNINTYFNVLVSPKTTIVGGNTYKILPDNEKQDVENIINSISNLINFGIIKNCNKFKCLLKYKEFVAIQYLSFILDMNNFDYKNFQISFMHYLSKNKTKEFKDILNKNYKISKLVTEIFIKQVNMNTRFNSDFDKDKIFNIIFNVPYPKYQKTN